MLAPRRVSPNANKPAGPRLNPMLSRLLRTLATAPPPRLSLFLPHPALQLRSFPFLKEICPPASQSLPKVSPAQRATPPQHQAAVPVPQITAQQEQGRVPSRSASAADPPSPMPPSPVSAAPA